MMDKAMESRICNAIRRTFEAIAGDLEAACAEMGESLDLESAIECSIDADRTRTYGGDHGAAETLYSLSWPEMQAIGRKALKGYV